jgi:valyl-tRNA synthetase
VEIPLTAKVNVVISSGKKENRELISELKPHIDNLAKTAEVKIEEKYVHLRSSISNVIKDTHVTIPLEGLVDIDKEKKKIEAKILNTEKEIVSKEKILGNKEFVKKAPEEIVEKEKTRLTELHEALKKLKAVKDGLR